MAIFFDNSFITFDQCIKFTVNNVLTLLGTLAIEK